MICLRLHSYYMKMEILVQKKKIHNCVYVQLAVCVFVCVYVFLKKKKTSICVALFSQISTYNF